MEIYGRSFSGAYSHCWLENKALIFGAIDLWDVFLHKFLRLFLRQIVREVHLYDFS